MSRVVISPLAVVTIGQDSMRKGRTMKTGTSLVLMVLLLAPAMRTDLAAQAGGPNLRIEPVVYTTADEGSSPITGAT